MMKRIIYTIGFLMFLSGPLAPLTMRAVSVDTVTDAMKSGISKVTDRIDNALHGKGSEGLDWGKSIGMTDAMDFYDLCL